MVIESTNKTVIAGTKTEKTPSLRGGTTKQSANLIPKLRFKEFDGDWSKKKLGDIATFLKGKGISKADISPNGSLECIRYGELYTAYTELIEQILSKTNLSPKGLILSEFNDVIIPASGESNIDIATASCVLKSGVAFSGDLNIIRSKMNGVFLSFYLNNKKKHDIAKLAQGVSVVHLYSSQLKTLNLNIPSLPEQQKIASFLSTVDKKIQQLTKKKKLLENYKKGVMQQLFSGNLRFKDENGNDYPDWRNSKIGDFLIESKIKGDCGDTAKKLTVKLWGRGVFEKIDVTAGSSQTQYFIRKSGQFIYSKLDFLNCAFGIIPKELDGLQSTVDLPCFDFKKEIYPYYILEKVKSRNFYKKLGDKADGSRKAKRIHADTFCSFPIKVPCLKEQEKIVTALTGVDAKIKNINKKIKKTQTFKKGLLQQMFVAA